MNFLKFFLLILSLTIGSSYYECKSYDITFYHVGQGDCTIIKSPTRQILFVDAGSSSAVGVFGVDTDNEEGKYDQLATQIVDSIRNDIRRSKWLYFVVSHSDKDHLNLIKPIILKSGFLDAGKKEPLKGFEIGVLLGGDHTIYSKGEGGKLVEFLKTYKVNHWFGRSSYELESSHGVFYVPKNNTSILRGWAGKIDFLSVGADALRKKPSAEDVSNASSIVMKVHCGKRTLMLTGDKTKKEIRFLINRFKLGHQEDELRSDILLATHHGSFEDFVEEWVTLTKPKHIVFSAGRSSFCHPRSDAFLGYLKLSKLAEVEWHFVQFHGDLINTEDDCLRSVLTEIPKIEERARGYAHAVTNRSIFVTGSQGNITFTLDDSKVLEYSANPTWKERHSSIQEFLESPKLPDNTLIDFDGVYLDRMLDIDMIFLFQKIQTMNSLTKLSLQGCTTIDDGHAQELSNLIGAVPSLIFLNLEGTQLSKDSHKLIKKTWKHRGLRF